ncbi:Elongation factor 1-beta [Galdieria sulphuraria]|nr:Elongation factor 1-beta [Galdieria sulphuraria]
MVIQYSSIFRSLLQKRKDIVPWVAQHIPTQQPTAEEVVIGNIKFRAFDLGGHAAARQIWRNYYTKVDAIVYMVDAADRDRLNEAKKELDALLADEQLTDVPFLILGNKIDVPQAASEEELRTALGVHHLTTGKGTNPVKDASVGYRNISNAHGESNFFQTERTFLSLKIEAVDSEIALRIKLKNCSLAVVVERPMVSFQSLSTEEGIAQLNQYLADKSYLHGVEPTKADVLVHNAIKSIPDSSTFPHVARWYRHIGSYSPYEQEAFPSSPETVTIEEFDADDLFASDDEEDEEAYREQQRRAEEALKAKEARDAAKQASGKQTVAKSSIVFEVKPWDDQTDLKKMEEAVRAIQMDGLTWGASKIQPIGYGINKLVIMCTIIDEKVPSTEIIEEEITALEDYVQSVDIAAFNKL